MLTSHCIYYAAAETTKNFKIIKLIGLISDKNQVFYS